MIANDNVLPDEVGTPDRPVYVARMGADEIAEILAILPAEEAARLRARAWTLRLVD